MAWINVINEEKATGSLKDQYNNLIEPWGGVDNILKIHSQILSRWMLMFGYIKWPCMVNQFSIDKKEK